MNKKIKKRIGLIHPVRGDGKPGRIDENIRHAIDWQVRMMSDTVEPIVPFLIVRKTLDDNIPIQRRAGIRIGQEYYQTCHEVHVEYFEQELSDGMEGDIAYCRSKGIPLVWETRKGRKII